MAVSGAAIKRYAQAAFQLALDRSEAEQWADELTQSAQELSGEEVRTFLQHAKVPFQQKVEILNQALPDARPLVRNLLALLVARGLAGRVGQVAQGYRRLLDQHLGRIRVEVESAVPLDDAERLRITSAVERVARKEVVLVPRVNPEILGGLVLRIEDRLLDGSTRTRLNVLRRSMAGG